MVVTATVCGAAEAAAGGMVQFSGSIDEVDGYLEKTFQLINGAAPGAVRETKKLLQSYSALNWKTARPRVVKLIAAARTGKEGQKGLKAFLDKQSPRWSVPPYGSPPKI